MFLVKTEFDERAMGEAIESEVRELGESPLYGCCSLVSRSFITGGIKKVMQ